MTNSRKKGKDGELEIAKILREKHGYSESRRSQQFCGKAGDADVIGVPGLHIEVKRTETLKAYDYLEQATDDARDGEVPVVFHRRSRKNWIAILDMDDFMELWKASH